MKKYRSLLKLGLKVREDQLFKSFILKRFVPGYKLVLDLKVFLSSMTLYLMNIMIVTPKIIIPSNFDISFVEIVHPKSINISLDEFKEKSVNSSIRYIVILALVLRQLSNPIITKIYKCCWFQKYS